MSDTPSDVLTAEPPRFGPDDVARIARTVFGFDGEVQRSFESERDQNFLISNGDEGRMLKISNAGERAEVLDMEIGAALWARRMDPSLPIAEPLPVAADPGTHVDEVKDEEQGTSHLVRMTTYLPGRGAVDGLDLDHDALWAYGTTVARLGRAMRGYFHPAANRVLLWSVEHCLHLRPMALHITDPARRALVGRVFDRFESDVAPRWPSLRAQLVHGDLTLDNALLDDDGRITGIVDFGDMSHTALLADPVSAVESMISMRSDHELFRAVRSLLDGYESVTPLEPAERELFMDAVAARSALTVTISAWRVGRFPENARYIQSWDQSSWNILERLDEIGPRASAERLGAGGEPPSTEALILRRARVFGTALAPLTYSEPLHLSKGEGPWLIDVDGRRYLDAYNNVPVVGHCHPRVANAIARQARTLNTNLRYLHPAAIELAERLVASMPAGSRLDTVLFLNAGSEATDLAWRIATVATGHTGGLVTEHAYHGVTTTTTDLSPEEWRGGRRPAHVEPFTPPDPRRFDDGSLAAAVDEAIDRLGARGHAPAAIFIDAAYTSDGIHPPPDGYHDEVAASARAAGARVVADEVQAGFGRSGAHLWSFVTTGLEPDLVTLGKPMGNGHPVAAVIARRDDVDRLAADAEFFSTFGGNPVAAAAGLAVLDVIEDERLVARAAETGAYLGSRLEELRARHDAIAAVRGIGLLFGVEIVGPHGESDAELTAKLLDGMRDRGVLVGSTGTHGNVLKIRPPLVVGRAEADTIADTLDDVVGSLG